MEDRSPRLRATTHRRFGLGALLLLILLAGAAASGDALAAPGDVAWSRVVTAVATGGGDRVLKVVPGPGGTAYAMGVYNEPLFSGYTWVARYTTTGRRLWLKKYGEAQGFDANCWAAAVDRAGNLVVAGTRSPVGAVDTDMLVLKYSPAGRLVWARTLVAAGVDAAGAAAVATDAAGNVYAAGYLTSGGGATGSLALVRWTASGRRSWVATADGTAPSPADTALAVAVDARGNAFVTGRATDTAGGTVCLTFKVDSRGITRWQQTSGSGSGRDAGHCVALRGTSVFVAGRSSDATTGKGGAFVRKYAASGAPVWTGWGGMTQWTSDPLTMALTPDGSIWLASDWLDGADAPHAAIQRFDASGALVWSDYDANPLYQSEYDALAVDASGRVWAAGWRYDPSSVLSSVFAVAYTSTGSGRWTATWRRTLDEESAGQCACLLGTRGLLVGGWTARPLLAADPLLVSFTR